MKFDLTKALPLALVIATMSAGCAFAQARSATNSSSGDRARNYWTAERMRNAIPAYKQEAGDGRLALRPAETGKSESAEGYDPPVPPIAKPSKTINLPPSKIEDSARSKGTSGIPYTTSLVFPDTQVNEMPYARTGKLFFTDADLNYSCSASIVRRRVVVTAAHCIYNTTANRFHSNFLFAPAYNANLATQPYGVWDWETVWAPNGWINGSETFPNQYDFGFIETRDFDTTVIGEYLGFFGWITNKVAGNSITQLGYSSNLDSGRRMIQNSSEARAASGGFAGVIGTGLHKGSSGGPWVQNFGRVAPGQVIVGGGSTNQITAVTSYGPKNNISPQYYSGATIFNSTFSSILNNTVCPHRTGNC